MESRHPSRASQPAAEHGKRRSRPLVSPTGGSRQQRTDVFCSLYSYNNVKALDEQALQYRSDAGITIGGLWFSTFFGGSDDSWAPPSTVNAYYRNLQLFGASAPSNLTGQTVSGAPRQAHSALSASMWCAAAAGLALAALGVVF